MSGFRLAGGDDIAVLVLFTGGTTSSSLERGNELRGDIPVSLGIMSALKIIDLSKSWNSFYFIMKLLLTIE